MTKPISDIAFTPAVKAVQERKGSRRGYEKMEAKGGWSDRVSPDLAAFIAARDSFY
ncbi:MAG: pyridoxamine 5'-phosphate oxidase, partial [Alphaproteobacteria bacterium]|nr:pyridoxamine 5'-phosphate oxidase [Alphaproteobacteria bacterium]